MKKRKIIPNPFGLTQLQTAMMLQIHPSQWSMHASRKRGLPTAAALLLAEILGHREKPEVLRKSVLEANDLVQIKKMLEDSLKENEYQLSVTVRKIKTMHKKYEAILNALQTAKALESCANSKGTVGPQIQKDIESTAIKDLGKNGFHQLKKLRIKEKVLQYEKELLLEEIKSATF